VGSGLAIRTILPHYIIENVGNPWVDRVGILRECRNSVFPLLTDVD
jgi:hypothetical protein